MKYKIKVVLLVLCIIQSVFLAPMFAQPLFRDALSGGLASSISVPTIPAAPALNFQKRPVFEEGINIPCHDINVLLLVLCNPAQIYFIIEHLTS